MYCELWAKGKDYAFIYAHENFNNQIKHISRLHKNLDLRTLEKVKDYYVFMYMKICNQTKTYLYATYNQVWFQRTSFDSSSRAWIPILVYIKG